MCSSARTGPTAARLGSLVLAVALAAAHLSGAPSALAQGVDAPSKIVVEFDTTVGISGNSLDIAYATAVQPDDGKIVVAGSAGRNFAVVRYNTDGSLDTGFGTDGIAITELAARHGEGGARALVLQSDGKIVVAGSVRSAGHRDFAVVRYNDDGSLDTDFGTGGIATTDLDLVYDTRSDDVASGIALQSDDGKIKIVVAGSASGSGSRNLAVVRYDDDGSLDTGFGANGVSTSVSDTVANAVAVDSNNKIVVAATATVGVLSNDLAFAVVRYNADGSLDTGFDTDGIAITDTAGAASVRGRAQGVAIQSSDGKIVVTGTTGTQFATARYNTDGSLDTGFGTDGIATTRISENGVDGAFGVAVDSGGKIVLAGRNLSGNFAVARLTTSGSLDTSFDSDGRQTSATTSVGELFILKRHSRDSAGSSAGYAVAVDSDDKIVVAGSGDGDFVVARYDPDDGSLDTSFDTDGIATTNVSQNGVDTGIGVAVDSNKKIVVVGASTPDSAGDLSAFAVARFATDGNLDTDFDDDGRVLTSISSGEVAVARAVAVDSNDNVVVVGSSGTHSALARFDTDDTDGTDDDLSERTDLSGFLSSFIHGAYAVVVQPDDGKIVAAGTNTTHAALVRYNTDGSLDTTGFGTDGIVLHDITPGRLDAAHAVALQSDNKIVIVGSAGPDGLFMARYDTDGRLDTGFGTDGIVTISSRDRGEARAVAVDDDDKILVAGSASNDFMVRRYNINGSLDTGFGTDGIVTTNITSGSSRNTITYGPGRSTSDSAHAIELQSNGKIVVAGIARDISQNHRQVAVVRYDTDGNLDTAFDTDGIFTLEADASQHRNASRLQSVDMALSGDKIIVAATWDDDFRVIALEALAPTAPDAPDAVTARPGSTVSHVMWNKPDSDGGAAVTSYTATASPGGSTCTTSGALLCTVSDLTDGTPYTFTVTATNSVGPSAASAISAAVTPAAPTAPDPPVRVFATPGDASARVLWDLPGSDGGAAIADYTVTASPGGSSCTSGARGCTVSDLANGIAYTFTVTATNSVGPSAASIPSRPVTPAAPTAPGPPLGVFATPGDASATVDWRSPSSNGGAAISGYTATASPGGNTCTSTVRGCTVSGLNNGIAYTFTVTATNSAGTSDDSTPSAPVTPEQSTVVGGGGGGFVGGGGGGGGGGQTVEPVVEPQPVVFSDVGEDYWAYDHVQHIASLGVTVGFPDGTYRPDDGITRAQMASFLSRALGGPPAATVTPARFSDVDESSPHFASVQHIAALGVTVGYSDGTYRPGESIIRAHMALFLYRAFDLVDAAPGADTFADVGADHNARTAVEALFAAGISDGCDNSPKRYCPDEAVRRGQMAAFLSRAITHAGAG